MSNQSLGSIWLSLTAETGGFVSALNKAAAEARKMSREIGRAFSELGEHAEQTFGAFGEFNPIISKLGLAIGTLGNTTSTAMKEFQKLPGALGPIAGLGVGAAAGLASFGFGVLAVAAHAAEAAAKMQHFAESAGMPVEKFSALSFAAKAVDVDVETLAGGLEKMSKSAEKAASAPDGASTAYTRLGISARDAAKNMKPVEDLLLELAGKFSKFEDGVDKTALAIEIFGKNGAALIPFLNDGPDAIKEIIEYAKTVGATLTGPAAEGAEDFARNMAKLSIAGAGVENMLMAKMLPTLQYLAEMFAKVGADGRTFAESTADSMAKVAKSVLVSLDYIIQGLREIPIFLQFIGGLLLGTLELIGSVVTATGNALAFDFSGARKELSAGLDSFTRTFTDFYRDTTKNNEAFVEFTNGVWSKLKPPQWDIKNLQFPQNLKFLSHAPPPPPAKVASGSVPADVVTELIGKLQAQATAELAIASATEKSAAATLLVKAAAEAREKIDETRVRLLEREKALIQELASARQEAGPTDAGGAAGAAGVQRIAQLRPELAGVRNQLAELQKYDSLITQLFSQKDAARFAQKSEEELQKLIDKTNEETASLRLMNDAMRKGPEAVAAADVSAKIAPYEKQLADMRELISRMQALHIPTGTVGSTSLIGSLFGNLDQAANKIESQIAAYKKSVEGVTDAKIANTIEKTNLELRAQAEAYALIGAAALKSSAEQREAAAQGEVAKLKVKDPSANPTLQKQVYDSALEALNQERDKTIDVLAVRYDLEASYTHELEDLNDVRNALLKYGESTIAIDTKIYETRIQQTIDYQKQVFESQNQQLLGEQKLDEAATHQMEIWDRAAISYGTLGEKFRAMANEIQLAGDNLGEKVFESFSKAIDDVSTQLAHMVVTGQNSFRQLFQSLEESLAKAAIQKGFATIAGSIFGGPPEANKQFGASGLDNLPLTKGAAGGGGGGILGAIGSIFGLGKGSTGGAPKGTRSDPLYVSLSNSIDSSTSAISGLGKMAKIPEGDGGDSTDAASQSANMLNTAMSSITGLLSKMTSSIGGIFGSIAGIFGLASGGRVSSGTPYIVGEKRPEIFVPDQAGKIIPSVTQFANSGEGRAFMGANLSGLSRREYGGSVMAGASYLTGERRPEVFVPDTLSRGGGSSTHTSVVNMHIHGVTDADSFRRSSGQIMAGVHRQTAIAFARNG